VKHDLFPKAGTHSRDHALERPVFDLLGDAWHRASRFGPAPLVRNQKLHFSEDYRALKIKSAAIGLQSGHDFFTPAI
jgi:hypothetical protein